MAACTVQSVKCKFAMWFDNLRPSVTELSTKQQSQMSIAIQFDTGRCPSAEVADMQVIARGLGYRVMGKGTDADIDLPAPFGALEPDEKIEALAWCARLRGLIDRSHVSAATTSAYLGLPIARSWPKPIWQLANLLTRQEDADMLQAYSAIQFHLRHRLPPPLSSAVVTETSKALHFARSKIGRRASARPHRPYLGFRVRKAPTAEDQDAAGDT